MNRQSFTEVFWILGTFLVSLGMVFTFIGNTAFENTRVKIQLHDTYFVIEPWIVLFSFFLILSLLTYLIKEGLKKFNRIIPNIIVSLIIIGNIIIITYFTNIFIVFNTKWILYPPLSRLAEIEPKEAGPFILAISIFLSLQFLLSIGLLFLGIKTGTLVKRRLGPTPGWRS